MHQSTSEHQALRHASRITTYHVLCAVSQAQFFEQRISASFALCSWHAMIACMEGQYFACSQAAVEIALLGYNGNALFDAHRIGDHINACDTRCAACRQHIGGQDANGGCFSGSVWP